MSTSAETKITLGELYRKSWAIFKQNLFAIIMVNLIVALPVNTVYYGISIIRKTSSYKFAFDILTTVFSLVAGIASFCYTVSSQYNTDNKRITSNGVEL